MNKEKAKTHEQAFPFDIDEKPIYSLIIEVKKNSISYKIEFKDTDADNKPGPTVMEVLGVLEYTKQCFGIRHASYVQEVVEVHLKMKENDKRQQEQAEPEK